jgi:hypothetical protein
MACGAKVLLQQPRVDRRVRPEVVAGGHELGQVLAGALQRAGGRDTGGAEQVRDLAGTPAQHVAQQQGGPLARREVLQRGDEGQPGALAGHDHVGRVAGILGPGGVREGLQPRRGVQPGQRDIGTPPRPARTRSAR